MSYSGAIDGIASGLNTTEIIESIMKYESQRINVFAQRQTEFTNKLSTWGSIEAMLLSVKSQASILSDEKLWYAKSAVSSDENVISINASNDAAPGTYYLTVEQLATRHQIASTGMYSLTESIGTGDIEISLGDNSSTVITIDDSNNTLTTLKDAINNSSARVTAAIINDGSEHNPYRLVLTAKDSGADNQITVNYNLSGGTAPEFSAAFDWTEKLSWSSNASSNPQTSTGAAYTGSENKAYTFTIGGTGLQTIGAGDIDIDWTDGTNSGTITVSTADTDIALVGDGADGLSVYFTEGALQAGDTFQVQAFAPTIQNGQDAIVQLGSSSNGGSPITFTHYENTIDDLIEGVTLELNSISTGDPVEITINEDRSQIKSQINKFVAKYNEYQEFVDSQFSYTEETGKVGVLIGDISLMMLHNNIRTTLTSVLSGRPDNVKMLSQVGVKFDSSGRLTFNELTFDNKINENLEDVISLFKSSGTTNTTFVEYISSNALTKISASGYAVDITQAARQGSLTASEIASPSNTPLTIDGSNNVLNIKISNKISSSIFLAEATYNSGEALAEEVENAINSDTSLSGVSVDVEWIDNGANGHLEITSSTYGSNSTVTLETASENTTHVYFGMFLSCFP